MGRISETILRSHLSDGPTGTIAQATSWAQKGLDIVIATRESHPNVKYDGCELAYIALLLNVALMRRVSACIIVFFFFFNVSNQLFSYLDLVVGR